MYCRHCGKEIADDAKFCPFCGEKTEDTVVAEKVTNGSKGSDKSRGLALILACVGFFLLAGLHRFYVGKIGTGVLWLLTGGLFGIGTIVDVITLCTGSFTDNNGETLQNWDLD